jgi:thiamine-phosphate pyrophosphorylase
MVSEAQKLKAICKDKALFLINDRVDVALAVDADGVHIGQDDMPFSIANKILGSKIIGLTVHNEIEAKEAEEQGANYVGLSPIYSTSTKKDAGTACGTEIITKVKKEINIPIVAVGGIDKENISRVIKSGADSAVAISSVLASDNVKKEVSKLIEIIKRSK